MASASSPPAASGVSRTGLAALLGRRLQPLGSRITQGIATTLTAALHAAGLQLDIEAQPAPSPPSAAPPGRSPMPATASPPLSYRPTVPIPTGLGSSHPASVPPARADISPVPNAPQSGSRPPTPVEVMNAVQSAVVGAVQAVSGTVAGVRAATDAARAASNTASGAASVAAGVATVATGFFPQLTKVGLGVKQAPVNRPGMRPQRRVADIIASPMGRTPLADSASAARPQKRIQRVPMVRAKSSLDLSRNSKTRRVRSYSDLAMRPQLGLKPHEILLKVATLTLGKTLLGFLEAGARAQQQALSRVNDRMSQKQIMLLGMLPAQYIVQKLPPKVVEPPSASATPMADHSPQASANAPSTAGGAFKIRY